jgi:hypothetical protein
VNDVWKGDTWKGDPCYELLLLQKNRNVGQDVYDRETGKWLSMPTPAVLCRELPLPYPRTSQKSTKPYTVERIKPSK